jgi:hypothetical protein
MANLSSTQELHLHFLLDHIIFVFSIYDLDANRKVIPLYSWHPHLNPTYGLQEIHMEYSFISNK